MSFVCIISRDRKSDTHNAERICHGWHEASETRRGDGLKEATGNCRPEIVKQGRGSSRCHHHMPPTAHVSGLEGLKGVGQGGRGGDDPTDLPSEPAQSPDQKFEDGVAVIC